MFFFQFSVKDSEKLSSEGTCLTLTDSASPPVQLLSSAFNDEYIMDHNMETLHHLSVYIFRTK